MDKSTVRVEDLNTLFYNWQTKQIKEEEKNFGSYQSSCTKFSLKWIIELNFQKKTLENLNELGLGKDFLNRTKGPSQFNGETKALINDVETTGYLYGKT